MSARKTMIFAPANTSFSLRLRRGVGPGEAAKVVGGLLSQSARVLTGAEGQATSTLSALLKCPRARRNCFNRK